jgi:hypothetical protein
MAIPEGAYDMIDTWRYPRSYKRPYSWEKIQMIIETENPDRYVQHGILLNSRLS